ncbi:uncharacterized protein LOC128965625 [Oppia nitens]|uniref:uncharacterized protein LOC128965625 n=1 Tax=Oppia nitens TaxID=1686743 RepID=UPI0023DC4607|nr:uncharacterized protein LOC128965625 [Oppia nitens]
MAIPAKDSFERFGDDLTEDLLDYLQFDDKFYYECISRQWQRLVYNKVNTVEVVAHETEFNKVDDMSFDLLKWQTIFKKCRYITTVSIDISFNSTVNEITEEDFATDEEIAEEFVFIDENDIINEDEMENEDENSDDDHYYEIQPEVFNRVDQIYEQMTDLVFKECSHLTRFKSMALIVRNESVIALIGKFGRQLETFQFPRLIDQCLQITQNLSLMPNLKVVDKSIAIDGLISSSTDDNRTDLIPKRLRVFDYYLDDNNVDKFAKFTDICSKRKIPLSRLKLEIRDQVIDKVINCLPCFASLTDINIYVEKRHINREQFRQLLNNCPKLKRFAYKFSAKFSATMNYKTVVSDINEVFGGTHVWALSLAFVEIPIDFEMTCDMLNRCRQLRRLTLSCYDIIRDPFFVNLAINLPNLRDLCISYVELTDQSLESLSKLQQLATFTVHRLENGNYSESRLMYLEMRPKFRQFTVTHRCIYSQFD